MIAHFDGGDTFSNGLNNATAFVAQDGREIPLGIGAGQCVGVCVALADSLNVVRNKMSRVLRV